MTEEATGNWASPRHVALLLIATNRDLRGKFMRAVALELLAQKQSFMAGMFNRMADEYAAKIK